MKNVAKPVILTIDQIDKNDRRFDLFVSDSDKYHFTDIIILQETERGCRIVTGFEMLREELPARYQFPAVCFRKDIPLVDILKTVVEIRIKKRPLLPVETARILQLAREHNVTDADLVESLFPALGLKSDNSLIERYIRLLSINEPLTDYLIAKKAPLKTWLLITKFSPAEQADLQELVPLRPTLSVFEEIAVNLYEIQKREDITQKEMLEQLRWSTLINGDSLVPKERVGQIREAVFRRRYPLLAGHKERVAKALHQISLPGNAGLYYDETFEKKELQLHWRLTSDADINRMRDFYTDETIQKLRTLLAEL